MRLRVGEAYLTEETSEKLRQQISEQGKVEYSIEEIQQYINENNYTIGEKDAEYPLFTDKYNYIFLPKLYCLGYKEIYTKKFTPVYDLFPDKDGVIFQIYEGVKPMENKDHLKKILYKLKINGWENKNKVIEGLVESGYVVGAELEKDSLGRTKSWRIDIYER